VQSRSQADGNSQGDQHAQRAGQAGAVCGAYDAVADILMNQVKRVRDAAEPQQCRACKDIEAAGNGQDKHTVTAEHKQVVWGLVGDQAVANGECQQGGVSTAWPAMAIPPVNQHTADEQRCVAGKQQVLDQKFKTVRNGFPPDHGGIADECPKPEHGP